MLEKYGYHNGLDFYSDPFMEDGKFVKGRKANSNGGVSYPDSIHEATFVVANPKTIKIIYNYLKTKNRKEKLNKINENRI